MARITRDSSVLNQIGSPSINSNTFANRPSFGQVGRLFVDTTNNILQRDTGSSWVTIGAASSTQNLESVTTNGNTTTKGIFAGSAGSLSSGFLLEVLGRTKLTSTSGNTVYIGLPNITPNAATLDVFGYSSFRLFTDASANIGSIMRNDFAINMNANITTGDPSASINQLTLTCNYVASIGNTTGGLIYAGAGLNKNTITDNGTSNSTITLTQNSGIFALTPLQSISEYTGLGGTNITHYAGLVINGVNATAGSALRITNNYQLLINSSEQFTGSTTVINKWGIYQNGINDYNYFASKLSIGTTTFDNNVLKVNGSATIDVGYIGQVTGYGSSFISFSHNVRNGAGEYSFLSEISGTTIINSKTGYPINLRINNLTKVNLSKEGNFLIGTEIDTTRKLVVAGQQEFITTTDTGVHTPNSQHLPIWVNGNQYFLQLLNPSA